MWEEDNLPSLSSFGIKLKEPEIELPNNFNAVYKDDFDILSAHRFVLAKLDEKIKKSKVADKIKTLEKELQKRQSLVDRKDRLRRIEKLRNKQQRLATIKEDYTQETKEVLAKYKEIGSLERVLSFSSKEEKKQESDEKREYRQRLILDYLEKTRRYYQINAVWESDELKCPGCGAEFPHEVADEFTPSACAECGVERKRLAKVPFSSDNVKDNINRNNYEERKNFIKAMERFQGKQVIKNTKTLFMDLDDFFTSYGMKRGEQVRDLPVNDKGKKEGTSKPLMFKALNEKGYSHYYKNINLICHLYWGWNLPDLSDIEDKLLTDYDAFQRVYEKLKTGRRSCLNTDYMLLILLLKQGYKCSSEDFKIVRTDDIFDEYEDTRRKVYDELGWKPVSLA
ncbi:Poxvirus VLTF3-like late transcription factor [Brazilian cedratvirus IHUMI]|uniref:Poxvirus VLTF3-like late transcription factor n=1 Tax=Brazilian cedratvirus IHUMI TaxID=2126980 RepID=A0A2R8FDG4_9VIRU|nr:Poxvirus VLTF3-like late transcription factor [Brazilian cedratvirus IHUMI]